MLQLKNCAVSANLIFSRTIEAREIGQSTGNHLGNTNFEMLEDLRCCSKKVSHAEIVNDDYFHFQAPYIRFFVGSSPG